MIYYFHSNLVNFVFTTNREIVIFLILCSGDFHKIDNSGCHICSNFSESDDKLSLSQYALLIRKSQSVVHAWEVNSKLTTNMVENLIVTFTKMGKWLRKMAKIYLTTSSYLLISHVHYHVGCGVQSRLRSWTHFIDGS